MSNFYVTLPSNASMDIYPDNAISHYTTRLRQPIDLEGDWEVALVEASIPTRWTNVTARDARMRVQLTRRQEEPVMRDGVEIGIKSVPVKRYFSASMKENHYERPQQFARALNRTWSKLRTNITAPYRFDGGVFKYRLPFKTFKYDAEENVITLNPEITQKIQVTNKLGLMLGISDGTKPWVDVPKKKSEVGEALDTSVQINHIYLYTDITKYVNVGEIVAPLLRIIPMQSYVGNNRMDHYTHIFSKPHYIPVSRQNIESIHIDLRNDLGENIPFIAGRSIVKLHFRRPKLL